MNMEQRQNSQLLWRVRRKITDQLESVPLEKRAELRASLRGIDLLLKVSSMIELRSP